MTTVNRRGTTDQLDGKASLSSESILSLRSFGRASYGFAFDEWWS
jgi:hypothetical protein